MISTSVEDDRLIVPTDLPWTAALHLDPSSTLALTLDDSLILLGSKGKWTPLVLDSDEYSGAQSDRDRVPSRRRRVPCVAEAGCNGPSLSRKHQRVQIELLLTSKGLLLRTFGIHAVGPPC